MKRFLILVGVLLTIALACNAIGGAISPPTQAMLTPMVPTISSTITATLVNRDTLTSIPPAIITTGQTVQPEDFQYLGAFRLPGGDTPPQTFAYGGNAMTFNPDGDPSNSDAYPGSLFIMGHDRQAWGGLPNG
ncbi:MAG: hypothetical protein MUO64_21770, partial [Anaerolineales bacterium]|nr:hypothetical protein [Anaerolineales bacterium]